MSQAVLGSGFSHAPAASFPTRRGGAQAGYGATFGAVWPANFYQKMSTIERTARDLNDKVLTYSRDVALKNAWKSWYASWRSFYDQREFDLWNFFNGGIIANAVLSDEVNAQVDEHWRQLAALQGRYEAERDPATGRPLPPPIVPLPSAPPVPKENSEKGVWASIPWWLWTALGLGVIGVGTYAYLQYREFKAAGGIARRVLGGSSGDARRDVREPTLDDYVARSGDLAARVAHHGFVQRAPHGYPPPQHHGYGHQGRRDVGPRVLGRAVAEPEHYEQNYEDDELWGTEY